MSPAPSLLFRCILAAVSGLIYALAFPPVNGRWLVLPALIGLLLAIRGLKGHPALIVGLTHGLAAFALGLTWLWNIFGPAAVALWAILAVFPAAFAVAQGKAQAAGLRGWHMALFTMVNWAAWEFIRAELFPLRFPWMTVGLAMGPNALLPRIGVYGSGACLVLAASLLMARRWFAGVVTLGALIAMTKLNETVPTVVVDKSAPVVRVAALQREEVSLTDLVNETRKLPEGTQHVVWPEHAVAYDVRAHKAEWDLINTLCKERDIALTLGVHSAVPDAGGWHNTALTLDALGVRGEHHKVHPVHFFDDGVPGTTALPVSTQRGNVGTPVCFDCDFSSVVRRMTWAGAEIFVVPSMDAAGWGRTQHLQHAELFRIRASENGRWMMVCASSGVSQIIDSRGHTVASLPPLTEGVLGGELRRETRLTFFTRFGWLCSWVLLAAAGVWWIILLLPRRAAKNKGK